MVVHQLNIISIYYQKIEKINHRIFILIFNCIMTSTSNNSTVDRQVNSPTGDSDGLMLNLDTLNDPNKVVETLKERVNEMPDNDEGKSESKRSKILKIIINPSGLIITLPVIAEKECEFVKN